MKLWSARGGRGDLVDLFSGARSPHMFLRPFEHNEAVGGDQLTFLFASPHPRRQDWPVAIVADRSLHQDLLAWLWTYQSQSRPITAHLRLLAPDELGEMRGDPTESDLHPFLVALTLSEVRRSRDVGT